MTNYNTSSRVTIEGQVSHFEYFKELYQFRELLYFFTWRDLIVHYKQTYLSVLWIVIRPLLTMGIFVLLFGRIAGMSSQDIPYPLFVLMGMLPWQFFSGSVNQAANSLIDHKGLLTKVYFPRILIPSCILFVHLVDFLVIYTLFLGMMVYYQTPFLTSIFLTPLFLLITLLFSLGCSLWLSALCISYRDIRIILPYLFQLSLFLSPIAYSTELIPQKYLWIFSLNPLVGIIEGFRWATFGSESAFLGYSMGLSIASTLLILGSGYLFFRRQEKIFADIV